MGSARVQFYISQSEIIVAFADKIFCNSSLTVFSDATGNYRFLLSCYRPVDNTIVFFESALGNGCIGFVYLAFQFFGTVGIKCNKYKTRGIFVQTVYYTADFCLAFFLPVAHKIVRYGVCRVIERWMAWHVVWFIHHHAAVVLIYNIHGPLLYNNCGVHFFIRCIYFHALRRPQI